jgi:uncharacterized RDD family membrane protein YckC
VNEQPVPYAGIVSRGLAFVVDAGIVVSLATAATIELQTTGDVLGVDQPHTGGGFAVAYLLSVPAIFSAYCALFWTLVGRTPGMRIMGLRLTGTDGGRVRLGQAVVRALAYSVSAVLFVGYVWIAVDSRRQGFHDKLARTFVRYDTDRQVARSRAGSVARD